MSLHCSVHSLTYFPLDNILYPHNYQQSVSSGSWTDIPVKMVNNSHNRYRLTVNCHLYLLFWIKTYLGGHLHLPTWFSFKKRLFAKRRIRNLRNIWNCIHEWKINTVCSLLLKQLKVNELLGEQSTWSNIENRWKSNMLKSPN